MSDLWPEPGQINDEAKNPENASPAASLETLRSEIDEIDAQLTALLLRRFTLTGKIGKTKLRLGRKVKDEGREQKVLERVSSSLGGSDSQNFILSIFKSILNESVEHQKNMER